MTHENALNIESQQNLNQDIEKSFIRYEYMRFRHPDYDGLIGLYNDMKSKILSGNLYLLGELEVSENEYNLLLKYTEDSLKHFIFCDRHTKHFDPLLALTLVQVGIRKYEERKFWDNFDEELGTYGRLLDLNDHSLIGSVFLRTLSDMGLYVYRKDSGRNLYVMNILMHGFVADKNAVSFYNFVESYFEKNLFYHIDSDIEEDLEDLSEWMKKQVYEGTYQSVKNVANSQILWKGTKLALADATLSGRFMRQALKNMDDHLFGNSLPEESHLRLNRLFIDWTRDENVREELDRKRRNSQDIRLSYRGSRPYFIIDREKESIKLIIPPQKFRDTVFEEAGENYTRNIRYKIAVKGDSFENTDRLPVLLSNGTYMSKEVSVSIPADMDILGKTLSVSFVAVGKEETDHIRLKDPSQINIKNYILFDENFCSVNKPRENSDKYFLLTGRSESVISENEEDLESDYPFGIGHLYELYDIHIRKNSLIYIGDSVLTQSGGMENESVFDRVENVSVTRVAEKTDFLKNHPVISFSIPEDEIKSTLLIISDGISKCNYRIDPEQNRFLVKTNNTTESRTDPSEGLKQKYIASLKNVPDIKKYGYYSVQLKTGRKMTTLITYLLIPDFSIEFDKQRYVFDEIANLSLNYDMSETGELPFGYDDKYIRRTSENDFRIVLDQTPRFKDGRIIASFSLAVGENNLTMNVVMPVFLWRFSNISDTWRIGRPGVKELIRGATNLPTIDVIIPGKVSDVSLKFGSAGIVRAHHFKSGYYRFDPYKEAYGNSDPISKKIQGRNFLKCSYLDENYGKKHIRMFNILTKTWIKNFGLYSDPENNIVQAHIDYTGICELEMEIYDDKGSLLYTGPITSEKPSDLPEISGSGKYQVKLYECYIDENDLFADRERSLLMTYTDEIPVNLTDIRKYTMKLMAIDFDDESPDFRSSYVIKDIIRIDGRYYGKLLTGKISAKHPGRRAGVLYEDYYRHNRKPSDENSERIQLKDRDVRIDVTYEENDSGVIVPKIWLAAKRKKDNTIAGPSDHGKMKSPDDWKWDPICFDRDKNELCQAAIDSASDEKKRHVFLYEEECNYKVKFCKDEEEI